MFKRFVLLMSLVVLLASGCGDAGTAVSTATLLLQPTQDALVVISPSAIPPTVTLAPATAVPEPEVAITELPTIEPTETAVPAPTESPIETSTEVPAAQPELAAGLITMTLAEGEQGVFTFTGTRFEPWLFVVEASEDLDTAVAVYPGVIDENTDLTTLTAEAAADFAGLGIPKLVVFTPDSDGEFSLVVTAAGEGTAVIQSISSQTEALPNTLPANEVDQRGFYNNLVTAVYIFVVPVGQADLALHAVTLDGEQIAEANFGGARSAEALFVLPPQAAGFNFEISEVNGAAAEYHLFIGSGRAPEPEE